MKQEVIQEVKNAPEFVQKLLKMMKEFPQTINFSQDGTELVILNKTEFIDQVLPRNFRHGNWRSFIRQLNMYNFRKINRGIDKEIFVNMVFQRGNEANYDKIRRKTNSKEEQQLYEKKLYKKTIMSLDRNFNQISTLTPFISDIFKFKFQTDQIVSAVKKDIDELGAKKKTKDHKPTLQQIKESFQMIEEVNQKLIYAVENFNKNYPTPESHFNNNFKHEPIKPQITTPSSKGAQPLHLRTNPQTQQQLEEKRMESRQKLGFSSMSSFSSVTRFIC